MFDKGMPITIRMVDGSTITADKWYIYPVYPQGIYLSKGNYKYFYPMAKIEYISQLEHVAGPETAG